MRIMSLQQFVQQAREPQDPTPQKVLAMDVHHFLDAVATNYEDDCIAEVTLNSPEPDSISVKFFVPGEEPECVTEQLRDRFRAR
jgi:hypothetical protein